MDVELVCQNCGKKYCVPHWREHTSKYCSRKCSDESKKGKPNLTCANCGKKFHKKPFHIKKYKGDAGFCCSKSCRAELMKTLMKGEGNHQYGLKGHKNASFKGERLTKKNHKNIDIYIYVPGHPFANKDSRVLEHRYIVEQHSERFEDKFFTVIDGKKYLKKCFDVHHIDGDHNNNDIDNLQPMTRSEHTSLHNKEKTIKRGELGRIIGVLKRDELLGNPTK